MEVIIVGIFIFILGCVIVVQVHDIWTGESLMEKINRSVF